MHASIPSDELSPTRLVRLIDRLNIGGPAKHVVWLTAGVNSESYETKLVTGRVSDGEGDMGYFARAYGVEPEVMPTMSRELCWGDGIAIFRLLRQLWKFNPKIIHTHKAKAGAIGRVAAFLYKWITPSALWLKPRPCRVVHTFHGHVLHSYFGPLKTRLFISIEQILARLITDCIVTVSEEQKRELSERFRIGRSEQYRVIPLGLDTDEGTSGKSNLRQDFGLAPRDIVIGIVGRLCEVKHHTLFLEAAAQLVEKSGDLGDRLRFIVIGDGHLREALEIRARELGIAEQVVFAGFREDVLSLYLELDIVALTSLNEGTPLTLIEAMLAGRAVVSTQVGGVVDIMGHRDLKMDRFTVWEHGVTVPSRDVSAFAQALQYLIERPELRREMGAKAQAFVAEHSSKNRLIRDIEALYHDLLKDVS